MQSADLIAKRDGYRLWCEQAGVRADFPERFNPSWHVAMVDKGAKLISTARLFAGILAARCHDEASLRQLKVADRKWCMSIALTQPLKACCGEQIGEGDIETRGLAELSCRLEAGFPGMWSRLRLLLPEETAARLDSLMPDARSSGGEQAASEARAQRCWLFCQGRVTTTIEC